MSYLVKALKKNWSSFLFGAMAMVCVLTLTVFGVLSAVTSFEPWNSGGNQVMAIEIGLLVLFGIIMLADTFISDAIKEAKEKEKKEKALDGLQKES